MDVMEVAHNLIFESDEEDEVRNIRVPRPRFIRDRLEHFTDMDDIDFVRRFRLSKRSCLQLLELIEHRLEFPSDKNYAVSPINQLLLALRFYATGCTQISASDFSGVSEATAHRAIHRVSVAVASLYRQYISFPRTEEEVRQTQAGFYLIARFPRVIGAIDCSHVKIRSPGGDNAEYFRNRKGYFSINVQAICNSKLEFLDVVARWPGSSHDQTIFDQSQVRARFELNEFRDALLLGDGGYGDRPYLMTPLANPTTPEQNLYNESQIRTRNAIERIFGVWKRRFPVLAVGLNVCIDNVMPIIVATAVLFNILRKAGDPEPPNDPMVVLPMPWDALLERGQIRRNRNNNNINVLQGQQAQQVIINDYFRALHEAYAQQ